MILQLHIPTDFSQRKDLIGQLTLTNACSNSTRIKSMWTDCPCWICGYEVTNKILQFFVQI